LLELKEIVVRQELEAYFAEILASETGDDKGKAARLAWQLSWGAGGE
jgi:hypothetical protein